MKRATTIAARSLLGFLLAIGTPGCRKPAPKPDELAPPAAISDLTLASSHGTARPTAGLRIYMGRKTLWLGTPPRVIATLGEDAGDGAHGFDASLKRSGPHDLFLVPLHAAVPKGTASALVYFDRDTAYRTIVEVVFTLGQAEVEHIDFITTSPGGAQLGAVGVNTRHDCLAIGALNRSDIPPVDLSALFDGAAHGSGVLRGLASAASSGPPPEPPPPARVEPARPCPNPDATPRLRPAVLIVDKGFSVKARGGNVAPGCNDLGPGVAVPLVGGRHDLGALTACLAHLKGAASDYADERTITISANPTTKAQLLFATIDAAAATGDGGVLFPDVAIGIVR